jgi:hypothetical protein
MQQHAMDYTMDVVMHDAMNDSMHPCRALCGSARAWLARRFESRCLALASRSASIRAAASSESRRIAPFISGSDERGAGALRMPRRGGPVTLDGFCPRLRAASACSADAVQVQCRCSADAVQMQCRCSADAVQAQCMLALREYLLDGAIVRVGRVVRRSRQAILVEVDCLQLRQPALVDGFRQSVDADGADLVELEAELLETRQRTLGGGRRERHDAGVADAVAVDKEPLQLGEDAATAARRREVREVSEAVVVQPVVGEGELAHLPVAHCGQRLVQLCHVLRLEQPAPQVDLLPMLGASSPHLQYV